jgi:hypothetical protein
MADMYGAVRSNEFKVKDVAAFKTWFDGYHFGDEIDLWIENSVHDSFATASFGGLEQYPTAYPRITAYDEDDEDVDIAEVEYADLQTFADELRQHLLPGEVFQVVAGGNEKLRYVGFNELIIAEDVETPSFQAYYSDDKAETVRARMKKDVSS